MAFKTALSDLSSSDSSSEENEKGRELDEKNDKPVDKKGGVSVADLQKFGYRSASVLLVPESGEQKSDWQWSDGRQHASGKESTSKEERETIRDVNDLTALAAKRSREHTAHLKKLKKQEWFTKRQSEREMSEHHRKKKKVSGKREDKEDS